MPAGSEKLQPPSTEKEQPKAEVREVPKVPDTQEELDASGSAWEAYIEDSSEKAKGAAGKSFAEAPARIGVSPEIAAEAATAAGVPEGLKAAEKNLDTATEEAKKEIAAEAKSEATEKSVEVLISEKRAELKKQIEDVQKEFELKQQRGEFFFGGKREEVFQKMRLLESSAKIIEQLNKKIAGFDELKDIENRIIELRKKEEEKGLLIGEGGRPELRPPDPELKKLEQQEQQLSEKIILRPMEISLGRMKENFREREQRGEHGNVKEKQKEEDRIEDLEAQYYQLIGGFNPVDKRAAYMSQEIAKLKKAVEYNKTDIEKL